MRTAVVEKLDDKHRVVRRGGLYYIQRKGWLFWHDYDCASFDELWEAHNSIGRLISDERRR